MPLWFSVNRKHPIPLNEDEAHLNKLAKGLAKPLYILAICFVLVIVLVMQTAARFDVYATENSKALVSQLLKAEQIKTEINTWEYAFWNESVENIIYNPNFEWAEVQLGGYLADGYGYEWLFALNAQGQVVYAYSSENEAQLDLAIFSGGIQNLIQKSIPENPAEPIAISSFLTIGNDVYLVAGSSFATYDPSPYPADVSHGVLIVADKIDQNKLLEWSETYLISGLALTKSVSNAPETSINIESPTGRILAMLSWQPRLEGQKFLEEFLPPISAVIFLLCIATILFYRRLSYYAQVSIKNLETLTESRKRLAYQAHYDELTKLPNRALLMERVRASLQQLKDSEQQSAILYMDLDNFKEVNDTFGHDVGDKLLKIVSRRLMHAVRKSDLVARFGGDEFCILLSGVNGTSSIDEVLVKIESQFISPCVIDGTRIMVEYSIGIVTMPKQGHSVENLLRFADLAMYKAKESSLTRYVYFSDELDQAAKTKAAIKDALRAAIENKELSLVYQPIYRLGTAELESIEALLRWHNPMLGTVSPEVFIPIAEESDLIEELGLWILEQSIKDIQTLNLEHDSNVVVSVNMSVRQFKDPRLPERISALLAKYQVSKQHIQLEITENVFVNQDDVEAQTIFRLAESGFTLVLDDFGTGYSSLSYLKNYPLTTLKIDRSFVRGIETDEANRKLIETIIAMAHNFKMKTVAEGIETVEQQSLLAELGCLYGQGYFYCRPAPLKGIAAFMVEKV